jgi:hypothetical protein
MFSSLTKFNNCYSIVVIFINIYNYYNLIKNKKSKKTIHEKF